MSDWQDISTAPKDGCTILAWDSSPMGNCVVLARWLEADGEYCAEWAVQDTGGDSIEEGFELTHWMPLPRGPKT